MEHDTELAGSCSFENLLSGKTVYNVLNNKMKFQFSEEKVKKTKGREQFFRGGPPRPIFPFSTPVLTLLTI